MEEGDLDDGVLGVEVLHAPPSGINSNGNNIMDATSAGNRSGWGYLLDEYNVNRFFQD